MLLCGICDLYVPLCFISNVQVLEVFLLSFNRWVEICWLRFSYCYCVMLEVNCLLIGDVRGELVVNDCH